MTQTLSPPKKISDEQTILNHLRKDSITHQEALKKYSISRLSEWIRRLRRKGHEIDCVMHTFNGREYGRYHLVKEKK